ncbi:dimethylargininase [candidate division KSB1 bacterium]|nr:dimethylargininase [candidate division KSB1 bacterium]NIR73190.1 dimethylargininase [candidate division KSB1 bacterium]NIS28339.1 dimethylargininase [candidate division KSB1 bacterium]NIT75231.1 dimethylargininase [candidate division KSB1 bacterium]NIU29071.1 dimethylargininase [candidate division KSB1 bacterium]
MLSAIVQTVSPNISQCELTFLKREPIDYEKAVSQHEAYCALLEKCGAKVNKLTANVDYPDGTFVEDTAVVLDEIAVLASMGTESRRGEIAAIETELAKYRKVVRVPPSARLEGGDVLALGSTVFVAASTRTDRAGIAALRKHLKPFDYDVVPVNIQNCLHLKSACSAISDRSLLVNPDWVDITPFAEFNVITVSQDEPYAANAIRVNETVCMYAGFANTVDMVRELGFKVATVDISEFLKAEGGMSCLSLQFES